MVEIKELEGKQLVLARKEGMSQYIRLDFHDNSSIIIKPIDPKFGAIITEIDIFNDVSRDGTALITDKDEKKYYKKGCGKSIKIKSAEFLNKNNARGLCLKFENGCEKWIEAVISYDEISYDRYCDVVVDI